jgi:hypothetical protein
MSIEVPIIIAAIAIPVYFVSLFVLKKANIGKVENRKNIALILVMFISPIIYVAILIQVLGMGYYPKEKFNQAKWSENEDERYKMSKNIISSNMLIGKTKEEVEELLGDSTKYYSTGRGCIGYYLGYIWNIDPEVLEICFENGVVIKVRQYTS